MYSAIYVRENLANLKSMYIIMTRRKLIYIYELLTSRSQSEDTTTYCRAIAHCGWIAPLATSTHVLPAFDSASL